MTIANLNHIRRPAALSIIYTVIIAASFYTAYEVRFDFIVPPHYQLDRLHSMIFVVALKLIGLALAGQFGSLMTYFSIPDLFRLIWATTASSLVLVLVRIPEYALFVPPRGVLLVDYLLCLAGLCAVRLGTRMYRERITGGKRVLKGPHETLAIVGAGDAGAALARDFVNSPSRGFRPVVFFDDDEKKHGMLVHGIQVVGRPELLPSVIEDYPISKLVIAMPTASAKRVREIVELGNKHHLKVETIPSLDELASGRIKTSKIRPVQIEDLLGRESVKLDSSAIQRLVEGQTVMVTGAGGSIGSELSRQILALSPKRLVMVERAEGSLFAAEQELLEMGFGSIISPLAADIRDLPRMEFIFRRYQPKIVFHAAAHKHVYLMERQPAEAITNNVFGTRDLAALASRFEVNAFILVSTDKAINPANVMGATKRLAELELQRLQVGNRGQKTKFIAVRFGNVLGSSGSVVPIFRRQIATGGPVTVTHPEVTRYFMTIPEAVGLVLQSAALGSGGEIFVLDMGQPVKIHELACQMIELSGLIVGEDIEVKFTGLKPGEKLFEELRHSKENHLPTQHPRVMRFVGAANLANLNLGKLESRIHDAQPNELKELLRELVPEYTPFLD